MKYLNTLNALSTTFIAKEHSSRLRNCEECKMYFHLHPSAELLLVTKGELTISVIGKPDEIIREGNCALIFPLQSHAYDRPAGTEYFRFNFSPSLLQSFFNPIKGYIGDKSVFPISLAEYEHFFDTVRTGTVTTFKVKGFLYNIIADYCRSVTLIKKQNDNSIIQKVIEYIEEHKSEKITIADTALALGYNDKYLSRTINEAAGFGFSTLLSTMRMETARNLLKNTQRTIVDIAIECGFGSERNFYRAFKEFTGYTPNEYRLSMHETIVTNDAVL